MVGLCLILVAIWKCRAGAFAADKIEEIPRLGKSLWRALPGLALIFVVLGGILGGVFTATEASAVAVVWAFALGSVAYREIPLNSLSELLLRSAKTTSVVFLPVAASRAMSQLLISEQAPQEASAVLVGFSDNPIAILLILNALFLAAGVFIDITPAILMPVVEKIGMDPVHFGIVMIANLCIGLCTPPVGTCLFVGCSVGKSDMARVARAMTPFYIAMLVALLADHGGAC